VTIMTNQENLTPDLLNGWEFTYTPAAVDFSFDMQAEPSEMVPIWRVDLPSDPKQAQEYISRRAAQLQESAAALESIPQRIEQMTIRQRTVGESGVSFDVVSAPLPEPETELLRLLDTIETREAPLSFGGEVLQSGELNQVGEQFRSASQRLLQMFSHFAWVETLVQGQLIGRTEVGWKGSMNTAWMERLDEAQMNLHCRNLETALASRNTSLRTLTVSMQTAVKLSVLLTAPGGVLLALPVAWKFVNQILAQTRLN
jgi:hypothetical protein